MAERIVQWLVITDLDGTLLNHHTYSSAEAEDAIQLLAEQGIPVIINTSKTYAETLTLREELGIDAPFIVENGSCIFLPRDIFPEAPAGSSSRDNYWSIKTGQTHQYISEVLQKIDIPASSYTRLSQCSIEQAIALTGLSSEQAMQAIAREFSEPLIWHADDEALELFKNQLDSYNLTTLRGGRFLHVLGQCDKGQASILLKGYYSGQVKTIILGDSANDAAMLMIADISVIVNSPSNPHLKTLITPVIQTIAEAPIGWSEGIDKALLLIANQE